jgi:hypothetical protein
VLSLTTLEHTAISASLHIPNLNLLGTRKIDSIIHTKCSTVWGRRATNVATDGRVPRPALGIDQREAFFASTAATVIAFTPAELTTVCIMDVSKNGLLGARQINLRSHTKCGTIWRIGTTNIAANKVIAWAAFGIPHCQTLFAISTPMISFADILIPNDVTETTAVFSQSAKQTVIAKTIGTVLTAVYP